MNTTHQREFWTGQPVELETMWILSKSGKVARLVLLTHQLGWELRVESGDLLLTQVCDPIGRSRTSPPPGGGDNREGLALRLKLPTNVGEILGAIESLRAH
jgi:hypothetical protein